MDGEHNWALVRWYENYSIGPARYLPHNGMYEAPVMLGEVHITSGFAQTREASLDDGVRKAMTAQAQSWGS